jgi:hypothetical protein
MSNPTTTGEWTARDFELLCAPDADLRARQVNEQLSAERKEALAVLLETGADYEQQLAAERERIAKLVKGHPLMEPLWKQHCEQLAEREQLSAVTVALTKTDTQLVAERAKAERLAEALREVKDRTPYADKNPVGRIIDSALAEFEKK